MFGVPTIRMTPFGHWAGRLGELANRCEPFVRIVMGYMALIN